MATGNQHQMVLVKFHTNGNQEWECPICRRRLLYRWNHSYEPVVLFPGDETARHGTREQQEAQPQPRTRVQHESGLSELWQTAIADLDLSGLPDTNPGLFPG